MAFTKVTAAGINTEGDITSNEFTAGDIFVSGIVTASRFVGDGSGLTNIVGGGGGVGGGVTVYNDGSVLGTVGKLDFATNINASTPASGFSTISVVDNPSFSQSVGVNTTSISDSNLVGAGNSFQGIYVSNGMVIFDNTLTGNHYIGTNYSGLMPGPANIEGVLTIDGEYVVV